MTRFENIAIGETFGCDHPTGKIVLLQKKSLSSAYTLNACTMERSSIFGWAEVIKFSTAKMVFRITC